MSIHGLQVYGTDGSIKLDVSDRLTRLIEEVTYVIPPGGSVFVPIPQNTASVDMLMIITYRGSGQDYHVRFWGAFFGSQRVAGITAVYFDATGYGAWLGTNDVRTYSFFGI